MLTLFQFCKNIILVTNNPNFKLCWTNFNNPDVNWLRFFDKPVYKTLGRKFKKLRGFYSKTLIVWEKKRQVFLELEFDAKLPGVVKIGKLKKLQALLSYCSVGGKFKVKKLAGCIKHQSYLFPAHPIHIKAHGTSD